MRGEKGDKGDGLNWRGEWSSEWNTFQKGDLCTLLGDLYMVTDPTTAHVRPTLPNSGWQLLVVGGDDRMRWCGEWYMAGGYQVHDVVSYNGSIYIRTAENDANYPASSADWTLLVKGSTEAEKQAFAAEIKAALSEEIKAAFTTEEWTFTLEDGSTVTKKICIVPHGVPCTGIALDQVGLMFGGTIMVEKTLVATVTPADCTEKVVWTSSDNSVATVADGVVTPIAPGSCVITAKCGAYSATCNVSVS